MREKKITENDLIKAGVKAAKILNPDNEFKKVLDYGFYMAMIAFELFDNSEEVADE